MGFIVGLTGGIASGKSIVGNLLGTYGIPIIDTDKISRELVEPGQPALNEIQKQFGTEVINTNGQLDRKKLREKVFSSELSRKKIENILHPRIRQETVEQSLIASKDAPYVLVIIPLLAEERVYQHYQWLDYIIGVRTTSALQKERLMQRPEITSHLAEKIIKSQCTDEQREYIVNHWIENSGDMKKLKAEVEACHHKLMSMSKKQIN